MIKKDYGKRYKSHNGKGWDCSKDYGKREIEKEKGI